MVNGKFTPQKANNPGIKTAESYGSCHKHTKSSDISWGCGRGACLQIKSTLESADLFLQITQNPSDSCLNPDKRYLMF